jgi:plastocyanin
MKNRKQRNNYAASFRITRKRMIMIGVLAAVISGVGLVGYKSMIPVNGTTPVLGVPNNHFIKATHSSNSGYHWLSVSSGSVKGMRSGGGGGNVMNPTYTFNKGGLETIHVINEDYTTHSVHNFNIDEFNFHTKDLGYYESQTFTIVADKAGTFRYYCSIHPEMKGEILVK